MTTNQELYKTAESRRKAFIEYCRKSKCEKCPLSGKDYYDCHFHWLELPADVQLKPCPFCGGEAEMVEIKEYAEARCSICQGVVQSGDDVLSAAAAWNHRGPYLT